MNILLDTQLLLWSMFGSARLSASVRSRISSAEQRFFSVVSLWEIVIKKGLGRADFQHDARALRRALLRVGYAELGVTATHVFEVGNLATVHSDPFDRLLLAQATTEGLRLLTTDRQLVRYGDIVERA